MRYFVETNSMSKKIRQINAKLTATKHKFRLNLSVSLNEIQFLNMFKTDLRKYSE